METVIFLDLDETLVRTEAARDPFSLIGETHTSILRPYAEEFLLELGSYFPLYLLTAGEREFQTGILRQHGIDSYFQGVFGRQEISNAINSLDYLVPGTLALLVDDLNPGSYGFFRKFMAIGNLPESLGVLQYSSGEERDQLEELLEAFAEIHYLQIKSFFGKPTDTELVRIFPEILKKASRLES